MGLWTDIGNWIIHSILEPCFGKLYPEITAIILLTLAVIFVGVFVYICVKYRQSIKEANLQRALAENSDEKLKKASVENFDLNKENQKLVEQLATEKLNVQDLKIEIDDLKNKLKDTESVKPKIKVEDVKSLNKSKRSEAAKKAAETRKKNKESQKTIEKLVDKE